MPPDPRPLDPRPLDLEPLDPPAEPDLHHHGDVEATPGLVDFAVNVHGNRPPGWLLDVLEQELRGLARYPDPAPAQQALATLHGVPVECVLLVAGAAEAFTLLAGLPWRRPLVVHPQFTEPEVALAAHGHRVDRWVLDAPGFTLGGAVDALPQDADLVVVGNPTNPTSVLHPRQELLRLLAPGRTVLVDEAFMDAVEPAARPRYSLVATAAGTPGLVVVRSLTKTYAIAGLRIGYLVAEPALVKVLARRQPHWSVGSLGCAAAVACAGEAGQRHAAAVRGELPARLAHLQEGLTACGLDVVPQARAPFLLARQAGAAALREGLRDRGFAVRRGDTFPGLGPDWLRVAARDQALTDQLLAAAADTFEHRRPQHRRPEHRRPSRSHT